MRLAKAAKPGGSGQMGGADNGAKGALLDGSYVTPPKRAELGTGVIEKEIRFVYSIFPYTFISIYYSLSISAYCFFSLLILKHTSLILLHFHSPSTFYPTSCTFPLYTLSPYYPNLFLSLPSTLPPPSFSPPNLTHTYTFTRTFPSVKLPPGSIACEYSWRDQGTFRFPLPEGVLSLTHGRTYLLF